MTTMTAIWIWIERCDDYDKIPHSGTDFARIL